MLEKLTDEQLSYIVGLFQGDASISEQTRNRGKLVYEISYKDKNIIDKLHNILSPIVTCKVKERVRDTNFAAQYHSISLSIYSKEFRDEIAKYIPTGHKSKTVSFTDTLLVQHYIRGLSDADGSLGLADTRCFWSLCTSSEEVKTTVLATIETVLGIRKTLTRNKRDNVFNIVLYNEDAQVFTQYLYGNTSLYIDRKYTALQAVLAWQRTIPKRKGRSKTWLAEEDRLIMDNTYSLEEKMRLTKRSANSIKTRMWRLSRK